MSIKLKSRNLLVSYIQIFLQERFGLTFDFERVDYVDDQYKPVYTINNDKKFLVTGTYDEKTYASLSLYMAYYYPEEGYPLYWEYNESSKPQWKSVTLTDYAESKGKTSREILEEVLASNLQNLQNHIEIADIPDRIVSYFLGEVVTPRSHEDEITRIQKMLYTPKISPKRAGKYDDQMLEDIGKIQEKYLEENSDHLPAGYEGFKVTRFVDPWTERILKEVVGYE